MIDTKTMVETCMDCTRVDMERWSELPDPSKLPERTGAGDLG